MFAYLWHRRLRATRQRLTSYRRYAAYVVGRSATRRRQGTNVCNKRREFVLHDISHHVVSYWQLRISTPSLVRTFPFQNVNSTVFRYYRRYAACVSGRSATRLCPGTNACNKRGEFVLRGISYYVLPLWRGGADSISFRKFVRCVRFMRFNA